MELPAVEEVAEEDVEEVSPEERLEALEGRMTALEQRVTTGFTEVSKSTGRQIENAPPPEPQVED